MDKRYTILNSLGCDCYSQLNARLQSPFESWAIEPKFAPCLQCSLEDLGIAPDEARASFDGFGCGVSKL